MKNKVFVLPLIKLTLLYGLTPFSLLADPAWNNEKLTGDWGGLRSSLSDSGFDVNADYTSYYQQVISNGTEHSGDLAHRVDIQTRLDSNKLGLWDGGSLHSQFVYRNGKANDFDFPVLSLPNAAFYGGSNDSFISAMYYSHKFDNDSMLMLGKIDAFELLRNSPFYGGAGKSGFNNVAFVAPPSGVTPPAFFGLISSFASKGLDWTIMVYDPRDRYTDSLSFDDLFKDGVNTAVSATHQFSIFDRVSSLGFSATYSTEEGVDLSSLQPGLIFTETKKNKYNVRLQFSHHLAEEPENSDNSWGVYLRGAIADGNPNMFSGTFAGGFGGKALFFGRPSDDWGIGYYYYNFSNDLQKRIQELNMTPSVENEQGVEIYYSYQVLPWLKIKADIQHLKPTLNHDKNQTITTLSANVSL